MISPDTITQRLLSDAGIGRGMRVIDIGCGGGDVSLLLAALVGATGEVVGIDRDADVLAVARERARARQDLRQLRFLQDDLSAALPRLASFDALVGRRVLMYLPNPAAAVRFLAASLKPGGIAVFQESDSTMVPGRTGQWLLHDRVNRWIRQTVEREGGNVRMGFELPATLALAGLDVEHVRAEAVIQGQGTHHPLAFIVRAMLPRITAHGVATEPEIDIETLEQRLGAELDRTAVYVSDMAFGAWARKPGAAASATPSAAR